MKIAVNEEKIFGNAANQSGSFSIAGNAMAFQILSSGIYKHKIRAVVRELVCNCVDAHMLNNQTKPFLVNAPNSMNSSFSVRDFGPGLSEKSMYEVYVQYFNSTKQGNEIGGFGLGAKSPFSYTDTFSVKSYYEGVLSIYNMYIDNGSPKIVKTYEGPFSEDDESGVEVIVPIEPKDISKWHSEISLVMSPFKKSQYEIKGYDLAIFSFEDCETYNDDFFKVNTSNYSPINAIYGNIVYPITLNVNTTWLQTNQKLMVHFDMNTLRPQPSREELQHDDFTVKNIEERFNKLNEISKQKIIDELSTMVGFRKISRYLKKLSQNQREDLDAQGILVDGRKISDYTKGVDLTRYIEFLNNESNVYSMCSNVARTKPLRSANYYSRSFYNISSVFSLHEEKIIILINDIDKYVRQTITATMQEYKDVDYFVVVHKDNKVNQVIDVVKSIMCDDEVIVLKASEMQDVRLKRFPKIQRQSNSDRPSTPSVIEYEFKDGVWNTTEKYYSAKDVSELNGFCFGLYLNKQCLKSSGFSDLHNFGYNTIRHVCEEFGITKLYGIRPKYHKKAIENENLKCFYSELLSIFANKYDVTKMQSFKVKPTTTMNSIYNKRCVEFYKKVVPSISKNDEMVYKAIDSINFLEINGKRKTLNDYIVFVNAEKFIETQAKSILEKSEDLINLVFSKHPLIKHYICHNSVSSQDCGKDVDKILKNSGLI